MTRKSDAVKTDRGTLAFNLTRIPVKRKSKCSEILPRYFDYQVIYHRLQDDTEFSQHITMLCSNLDYTANFFFSYNRFPIYNPPMLMCARIPLSLHIL